MNDQRLLHFSIGPVQDFVAQARRTRDLLAVFCCLICQDVPWLILRKTRRNRVSQSV